MKTSELIKWLGESYLKYGDLDIEIHAQRQRPIKETKHIYVPQQPQLHMWTKPGYKRIPEQDIEKYKDKPGFQARILIRA